jgi:hypothetical protein
VIRRIYNWLFPAPKEETAAERREKIAWTIIGSQIADTSRHHPR